MLDFLGRQKIRKDVPTPSPVPFNGVPFSRAATSSACRSFASPSGRFQTPYLRVRADVDGYKQIGALPLANLARSSNSMNASFSRVMSTRVLGKVLKRSFQQHGLECDIFFPSSHVVRWCRVFSPWLGSITIV